jgi:hypothetical protein
MLIGGGNQGKTAVHARTVDLVNIFLVGPHMVALTC